MVKMPKRKISIKKAWSSAKDALIRTIEVAKGERLARRKKARLDREKVRYIESDLLESYRIPLNRSGTETGMRLEDPPNEEFPKYYVTKKTKRRLIHSSFRRDGTLVRREETAVPGISKSDRPRYKKEKTKQRW